MDRCPICDVAVKPENLVRHLNDIHPRHPDTAKLVEDLKARPERVATRTSSRPFHISRLQATVVIVIILLAVGVYYALPYLSRNPVLPCVTGAGRFYHWHTQLTIASGGNPVTIPGDVGNSPCLQVLHTHDTTGLIHIEPDTPEQGRVYTVGDFFAVWGKSFGNPTRMILNGTEVAPSASIGLYDRPEAIVLEYASFTP